MWIGRLRLVVFPAVFGLSRRGALPLLVLPLPLLLAAVLGGLAGQRRELVSHDVAQRRRGHAAREALRVGKLLGPRGAAERESDLSLGGVDGDDLRLQRLARLDERLGVLDPLLRELGDVNQTLDALLDLDERAEVEHLDDLGLDDLAGRVIVRNAIPRIGNQLLDAK